MKFYLSSFGLGNQPDELVRLILDGQGESRTKKIAYIPNACDFTNVNREKRKIREEIDIHSLEDIWLDVEYLDLKDFFHKTDALRKKLSSYNAVFVRGGNTFILRQAMRLSGFDVIFEELKENNNFVYSGYSAGICVLAPNLKALQIVDDPTDKPYQELQETIWEGLGYLDYMILPHYKSDHPESEAIDEEVEYCKQNHVPFRTLKDGEVIIIE